MKTETIIIGTAQLFLFQGKWKRSPTTPAEMLDMQKENAKRAKCHIVREESVAAEPTTLFAVHIDTDGGSSDEQIWVSRRSSLPVKMDMDLRVGGDKVAKPFERDAELWQHPGATGRKPLKRPASARAAARYLILVLH